MSVRIIYTFHVIHRLMIGYSLSIGFIGIEMFGFMSGITMFSPTNGFICILFMLTIFYHCSAFYCIIDIQRVFSFWRTLNLQIYFQFCFFLNQRERSDDLPRSGHYDDVLFPTRSMELQNVLVRVFFMQHTAVFLRTNHDKLFVYNEKMMNSFTAHKLLPFFISMRLAL